MYGHGFAVVPGRPVRTGDGGSPKAPVRETELPLRERGGPPRDHRAQLLRTRPEPGSGAAAGTGGRGAGGSRALPGGPEAPGGAGERGPGGARGGLGRSQPEGAAAEDGFASSRAAFDGVVSWLGSEGATAMTHAELEERLSTDMRAVICQLFQDHVDLRSEREERRGGVRDAKGSLHGAVEAGHDRPLATVFGEVRVNRLAYRHRGEANLYPADADLNLPVEIHSHGLRRMAAVESSRGSFDEAVAAMERATGQHVPKRQVEGLAKLAAVDFEAFYEQARRARAGADDVVVISADGKGIVMRPGALRPGTAKAAASKKLSARLSKGERPYRKRMAEIGAVYEVSPVPRRPEDIMGENKVPAPVAKAKWLTASVVEDAKEVISAVFDEAERRDPAHEHTWVALVDGARHQIDVMKKQAKKRGVDLTVLCDFVHVIEYIWRAAWSFFDEGDPAAEAWVAEKATEVLRSKASVVAGSIRRKATCLGLSPSRRANADACAGYLIAKSKYLNYADALRKGWPIATGIIEGAARHLVADRLDITGARWGLEGAEAVLKLRAIRSNEDFPSYWAYHLAQERRRVHESGYANGVLPRAA